MPRLLPRWTLSASHEGGVHISRLALAAFTLPVLLFQAIEMTWRAYLPRFLNQDVGMAFGAIGALMLGARLLDALADPVIGGLSDGMTTRFGRRKPWMMAGALLVPMGVLPLFLAPAGASVTMIVGASLLLHLGYSFIITPHGGWGLEFSSDPHQRTRIMGAKVWFGLAGSLGLLGVMACLEQGLQVTLRTEMQLLGWIMALVAPMTVLVPVLLFREGGSASPAIVRNPLGYCARMLGQPQMRRVLILYGITGVGEASGASCFLFLTEEVLTLQRWGATLLLIQPISALVALPIWSRLSRVLGRERILIIAYGWQAICAAALFLVPPGLVIAFALLLAIKGLAWGVDFMLLRAMIADAAGRDEGRGGVAASYYGFSSIALKMAMGIGGGGALWVLGWAMSLEDAGFRSLAIRSIYTLPMLIGGLAGMFILLRRGRPLEKPIHAGTVSGFAG